MLKEKLTEIIGQDLTDTQLIAAVEAAITESRPFNHESNAGAEACGLDGHEFEKKWGEFDIQATSFSTLVELFEKSFDKREIAFLLSGAHLSQL